MRLLVLIWTGMAAAGGLSLPFENTMANIIKRFVSSAVGKIYKLHTNKLRELEAPWIKDRPT